MKKWVWHIGLAVMSAFVAACTNGDKVAGSSLETENSVAAVLTVKQDGSPAARTKVFVRPSSFVAGANNLSLSKEYKDYDSPVVEADSAAGILNLETDDQGQLELPRLKSGTYVVEAREASKKAIARIMVTDSSYDSVSIEMVTPGSISGRVYVPESESYVTVGIQGLDYFVDTDSAGNFEFKSVPKDTLNVVGFVYHVYKTLDLNGNPSTYTHHLSVGASRVEVDSGKVSKNVVIGQPPAPDTVAKDTNIYPVVLFEDFEDSTSGWYTNVSRYAEAKLGTDEDRDGLVAHLEYSNDSNYNWVLMGRSLNGVVDMSSMDSVVFYARGNKSRKDSSQWISFSVDVLMDSVELAKNGYENGKAWVHMTLDTAWTRYVVTPKDLADTARIGGNIGWENVKDHVTNLNFFGGGVGHDFEMWVDDVYIYGVKGLE